MQESSSQPDAGAGGDLKVLETSGYEIDLRVSMLLSDKADADLTDLISSPCASAIAGIGRPAEGLFKLRSLTLQVRMKEITPTSEDLSRGYYINCAATADRVERIALREFRRTISSAEGVLKEPLWVDSGTVV